MAVIRSVLFSASQSASSFFRLAELRHFRQFRSKASARKTITLSAPLDGQQVGSLSASVCIQTLKINIVIYVAIVVDN